MGFMMTAGIDHTLTTTIVDSRGFTAVMVSWMSKFNPFVMIAASLLLVTMDRGASEVASALSLNHSFADILTGIILFFIIATEFFITYKVTLRKSSKRRRNGWALTLYLSSPVRSCRVSPCCTAAPARS